MAKKAGFAMILSETLKTGFVASMLINSHVNADPIHKPGSCDMHIKMSSPSRLLVANSAHDHRRRDPYQK